MSNTPTSQPTDEGAARQDNSARQIAFAIYILYLANIFLALTGIVGVVMAYVFHGDGPGWLQSHYRFQIRTFWIGILYSVISIVLMFVMVGYVLALLVVLWLVIRCAKGMKHLSRGQPHPDPTSWLFG